MANFCLLPANVDKFKNGLVSGEINPEKLSAMTSDERRAFLAKYVGEAHAPKVNAEFESKLLLKNQQAGMINWAKNVGGISKQTRMDIISKIQRMDKVLDPDGAFLSDLAERRLGVGVTEDEARAIMDMSRKVSELDAKRLPNGTFASESERLDYGRAVFNLSDYVNDLKSAAKSMKLADFKETPGRFVAKGTEFLASNAKAINASMDNSAIFRQGWKTLWTNPKIWSKNAAQSFLDIARTLGGKNVKREVTADIVSRPNYELMQKAKLAVGNLEEAFPTTVPEKIPYLGRLYKASEDAYTAFVHRTRADVFDKYIEMAKNSGVDISDKKELEAIGRVVNSLTGRGNLGVVEPAANLVNNLFFSPRFLKSNIDTFIQPATAGTSFARKQATKNLLKIGGGTAGVLTIANALMPGAVEWDPRSSDFGKIRVGNTRYDVTGGMGSIAVLAARLSQQSTKSATTGIVSKLNTGEYGSQTGWDVLLNFGANKLSPASGMIRDILKGEDFNGNKLTVGNQIYQMYTPMIVRNSAEILNDPNSSNAIISIIADGLGISTSNYQPKGEGGVSTWSKSTSDRIKQFSEKVGDEKFKEASKLYDNLYNAWLLGVRNNPGWSKKTPDEQKSLLSKEANQLQKDIFKKYNFTYKKPKTPKADTGLIQSLNQIKR